MGKAGPGYRKPKKKKYFSKKDIISGIVILAVIAAAVAVLAVVISRDDFIRTVDGKLDMEPNWLVANYSNGSSTMYYKIGEVADIDGYTLSESSAQSAVKTFTPDSEDVLIKGCYFGSLASDYATAVDSMAKFYTDITGPVDITCAGRNAKYITSFSPAETAETDETAVETEETENKSVDKMADLNSDDEDIWVMITYIDYDDDHCVYIQLNSDHELTQEEAEEQLGIFAEALTLTKR